MSVFDLHLRARVRYIADVAGDLLPTVNAALGNKVYQRWGKINNKYIRKFAH